MRIGIDFDNTIVGYDSLFFAIAHERGLIDTGVAADKRSIRDHVRSLPDGETAWRELQAEVYGPRILEAQLNEGVTEFFIACRRWGIPLHVVSHKTMRAAGGDGNTDLREAARGFLSSRGFFDRLGVSPDEVYFEPTREEKCRRIAALGCTHFVDDLEETFAEPAFPAGVARILYSPHHAATSLDDVRLVRSWGEILDGLFAARC